VRCRFLTSNNVHVRRLSWRKTVKAEAAAEGYPTFATETLRPMAKSPCMSKQPTAEIASALSDLRDPAPIYDQKFLRGDLSFADIGRGPHRRHLGPVTVDKAELTSGFGEGEIYGDGHIDVQCSVNGVGLT
jgi:hypothetical protein